jgi:predicted RNase H-like HicB family nuclease
MELPVLIEPIAGNGYRASGASPLTLTAEGTTPEEALQNFQELLQRRVAEGAVVVSVSVPPTQAPWAPFAGQLRGDPMLAAWRQAMADYRRQVDEDPDAL